MKRKDLIKEIEKNGCVFIRHGGKHDWYQIIRANAYRMAPALAAHSIGVGCLADIGYIAEDIGKFFRQ